MNCVFFFQKAKADPRPVSHPTENEAPVRCALKEYWQIYIVLTGCVTLQVENDMRWISEEYDSSSTTKNNSRSVQENVIATTWKDGPYLLVVKIVSSKQDANWNLTGNYIINKKCTL